MNHFRLHLLACLSSLVAISLLALPALAANEKRVALVIGNSVYKYDTPLDNPGNDARAIAEALKKVGFELIDGKAHLDLDRQGMEQAISRFGKAIRGADVGLLYYSGHGVQVDGKNFLVPVSANVQSKTDIKYHFVDADFVIDEMSASQTKTNILILDACRSNPYGAKGLKGSTSGLAQMSAPRGTVIAYATAPGKTAEDGIGNNSPYAAALAKNIVEPGQRLEDVLIRTGVEVEKSTGNMQSPWYSTNLRGVFYFLPPVAGNTQQATPSVDPEVVYWQSIANSTNPASFESYLIKYPQGQFASLAKVKIAELKPKPQPQPQQQSASSQAVAESVKPQPQSIPTPPAMQSSATVQTVTPPSSPKVGDTWTDPVMGMKFVWVPGGTYEMGCGSWVKKECGGSATPVHTVTVDGFWLGQYEVTQKEWGMGMGSILSQCQVGDNFPVSNVSWDDVQDFIKRLNAKGIGKYRLPTDAEWEYAARDGGKKYIYAGGDDASAVAWYSSKSTKEADIKTHPVGQKQPNSIGVYDMSGNVAEWVADDYDVDAYKKHGKHNPIYLGDGSKKVFRGGSAHCPDAFCVNVYAHVGIRPGAKACFIGFRLVREP